MAEQAIKSINQAVNYIEQRLRRNAAGCFEGRPDLAAVAEAAGYSKFHLHRKFAEITGQTLHDYVRRRQLTEAARLLIFSKQTLLDIALLSGYASQQAFTLAFKEFYKLPPAEYRKRREFYPLQLSLQLQPNAAPCPPSAIRPATPADIPHWLNLVRQSVAGYPHWHEEEYCRRLQAHIAQRQALIWPNSGGGLAAGLAFSAANGCLDFLAVQPQQRRRGIAKTLLHKLRHEVCPQREIYTTTFRAGDRAESGQRAALQRLGFAENEPLTEFGYPTQRYLLPPSKGKVISYV